MSKLPEHALGLEVGGKRKCKPRSKSLYSTSADAKLNLFSLYSTLALEKKKKKKKAKATFAIQARVEGTHNHEEVAGGVPQDSCPTANKTDVNRAKSKCFREGKNG